MKKSFNIQELLHCKSKRHETKPMHPSSLINFLKKSFNVQELLHCKSKRHETKLIHPSSLINFQWRNHSIFKNFFTTSPNVMKPSRRTPPPWELSKETKNAIWSIPVWWISLVQNKTNKLLCFMDRLPKPWRKQSWSGEEEGQGVLRGKMKRLLINQFEIIIFSWSTIILSYEEWIIQILPCNNYDSFQYLDFFIYLNCFNILSFISMAKLTQGKVC